ncbi:HAD family hydrolase [Ornithinimicrobium pratense]|uniref:HAD family hydrolase n=1 Tax=Ornithinimicrobium pratense TaxID=2593973 RepID=A0A5J6V6L3_9MICO|nr:HAD-IA family hydrolase [Ornithinimicrobium pratense]QFG69660.1 HAD family hydrolase [Ornithinimicrobium pratense]
MAEEQEAWSDAQRERARQQVTSAALVLVDFDGPLARLLPGDRWREVAAQVRARAGELGGPELETALDGAPDHVQCLRRVHELAPGIVPPLVEEVTRLELAAAAQVDPADYAVEFIEQCLDRGSAVVVVTNNDPHVVARVLDPHRPRLSARLTAILGRDPDRLDALKPSPAMLLDALKLTGAQAQDAVFLGDSVTDVEAGRAAGVPVVGVAEEAERRAELLAAGALAAVPGVGHLLRPR